MEVETERALLQRSKTEAGATRDEALNRLLASIEPTIRALSVRLTETKADADDVVQDTLFAVYKGLPAFRGGSRLSTWAYRIAVRCASRVRARSAKHDASSSSVDEEVGTVPCEMHPHDIRRALSRLPSSSATILALFAVEGLSHREIAEILNVPEGTVWSRLHTARRRLAEELEGAPG